MVGSRPCPPPHRIAMHLLKMRLERDFPLGVYSLDLPVSPTGDVCLDAELSLAPDGTSPGGQGTLDLVFQSRAGKAGIGLSVIEPGGEPGAGYGEGPDEVWLTLDEVMGRVAELLALG